MPQTNTEINTDFIVEEYGRIYQQRGQGMDRIKRALIQKAVTLEKYATHKRLTDDIYEMSNDEFQPVLQPFRVPFEPKGGVKFHPNKIVLQHIKVDLQFSPDDVIDKWLGFLEGEGVKREQWPITKYMIEVYLKQQIDYDREVNAVYYGERDDAGTTPSACMDGIRKHLIDGANSQYPVNVISDIRRLQPDTCFDQVEAFSKKIKGIYRNVPIIICVSQDYERCFLENKRANGFYWLHGPEDLNASVDFTKQVVMGLPSMGEECGDMFAFVRGNLLWCTRKDKFNFDVQKIDRYVKVLGDWREGIGFGVNKMVWTTEETIDPDADSDTPDTPDELDEPETITVIPVVEPETATDVTAAGATLNGTTTGVPEGATLKFAYGTDPETLDGEAVAVAGEEGAYSAEITSLTAETKYYYQLQLTYNGNTVYSPLGSFTTLAS